MEILNNWISGINDLLWSYVLIIMLLGCAFRFTFKTRFVQFRMFREMIRVLGDSANKAHEGEKHISSFQAFAVSLASRVGLGDVVGQRLCLDTPEASKVEVSLKENLQKKIRVQLHRSVQNYVSGRYRSNLHRSMRPILTGQNF